MMFASLLLVVFLAALLMTGGLRRYALARQVLDIPNERSSHQVATPRGGGVAIVLAFLLGMLGLTVTGHVVWQDCLALLGAGGLVALTGFIDDHRPLPARWRLLSHFLAVAWLLAGLGGLPELSLFGLTLQLGMAGNVLAAVALVWLLNLYNFMDGIDGIASIEALSSCLGAALLYGISGHASLALLPLLLASAVAGFLFWNFPPARIFMGDAGSGFLGIALGGLLLQAAHLQGEWLWSWLILLAVFIVDATLTLLRRLLRGDKVYQAHRSHAYQQAARKAGAHLPVTLAVLAINLLWLLPLALLVGLGYFDGMAGFILACLPLTALALWLRAGLPDPVA